MVAGMSKYRNRKISRDGMTFDSAKEYRRFRELSLLETAGEIRDLRRQVRFELIPVQRIDGKLVERACCYVADFAYYAVIRGQEEDDAGNVYNVETWEPVVEDTKGFKTKDYIIKRKLMLWVHGIRIKEV